MIYQLQILPIPILQDNYVWIIHEPGGKEVIVIDPGVATPVISYIEQNSLSLKAIFITHSHYDHIDGIDDLLAFQQAPVYGPDCPAIPQVTDTMREGDKFNLWHIEFSVLHLPGHLPEHLAYICNVEGVTQVFSGDILFASGCGRIFNGTHAQLKSSLDRLKNLTPPALIYGTHEYTLNNLDFAQAVEPENKALTSRRNKVEELRQKNLPSLPTSIDTERECNPFLRCDQKTVIAQAEKHAGCELPDEASVFKVLREWKNQF